MTFVMLVFSFCSMFPGFLRHGGAAAATGAGQQGHDQGDNRDALHDPPIVVELKSESRRQNSNAPRGVGRLTQPQRCRGLSPAVRRTGNSFR